LHDGSFPYVVPLSFGLEVVDGNVELYFHGAKEGLKHELIAKNPLVCVEAGIFYRYVEVPGSVTTEFESVIGFGKAALVSGSEAVWGLDLLLSHCGFEGFVYDRGVLDSLSVYRIVLDRVTGKRRFVQQEGRASAISKNG
jgi:nitroimidazol reductase NimA-like FMN-containing flavoprotein (pyridoxamine 5'-phosphate oxidase superfamily)